MAALDPRIEEVRKRYDLKHDDFWELPQKKGTWVAKHAALEMAAVKAGIEFAPPQVLEANGEAKSAALCVTGSMAGRSEWSVGEANPANNRNAYPFAMAEKRAKDRVILKLIGLHGLIYSEEEADDFKRPATNGAQTQRDAIHNPPASKQADPDIDEGVKNWCDREKHFLNNCVTVADVTQWQELRANELDRLKRKALTAWSDLTKYAEARIEAINKQGSK